MNFAIIYTIIILLLSIPIFITDFAKGIPIGMRIPPIVLAISFLWLFTIFFRLRGRAGIMAVILLVLFYLLTFVIIMPTGIGSTVITIIERGKDLSPQTIGNDDFAEQIYIIYHSGISKFTDNTLSTLAENIAKNNYRVTLYHVEKNLKIDFKEAKAIGFASPIYAGSIRQRLANFIQQSELSGIECFVVLTGADKEGRERDTSKVAKLIEEKGGKVIGKEKFITSDKEEELQEKIDLFSKVLIEKL